MPQKVRIAQMYLNGRYSEAYWTEIQNELAG